MFWLDAQGRVLVDSSGSPINCATCPCGGGGGYVETVCCPDVFLPTVLCITISSSPGAGCSCLDGTYQLTWDHAGQSGWWLPALPDNSVTPPFGGGSPVQVCPAGTGPFFTVRFWCEPNPLPSEGTGPGFILEMWLNGQPLGPDLVGTLVSCNPLQVTYSFAELCNYGPAICGNCGSGGTFSITVGTC